MRGLADGRGQLASAVRGLSMSLGTLARRRSTATRLEREGYAIEAARGELRDLAVSIARRRVGIDEIAEWLGKRSRPL
jgi:hypothetical protein